MSSASSYGILFRALVQEWAVSVRAFDRGQGASQLEAHRCVPPEIRRQPEIRDSKPHVAHDEREQFATNDRGCHPPKHEPAVGPPLAPFTHAPPPLAVPPCVNPRTGHWLSGVAAIELVCGDPATRHRRTPEIPLAAAELERAARYARQLARSCGLGQVNGHTGPSA